MVGEEWRDVSVDGFKDFYEVSSFGRVRSKPRVVKATNRFLNYKSKPLKPNKDSSGYEQVCLCNHTKRKTVHVHSLVAGAFLGAKPEGDVQVCHNDGVRTHNILSNLRYDIRSNNAKDAIKHGTHNWLVDGVFCPPSKK